MNNKALKALAAGALLLGAAACTDLTTEPKSDTTATNVFNDANAYRSFIAKVYAGLAVSGQQGPAGSPDIEGIDEGFSQYLRLYWLLQELPTDEAALAWNDVGVPDLNQQTWGPGNQYLGAMYYRVFFQVMMANEFLRETTEEKLAARNVSPELRAQIQQYRAEARFLRALSYWHGIDLFANIPLVTDEDPLGSTPPQQATRAEVFAYVVGELEAVRGELLPPTQRVYGRADQSAADMLLAKLYLNAGVYAGQDRAADARAAVERVIAAGGYQLDDDYQDLFLADNHTSPEIIFAIPQDGTHTRTWGGMTFLVNASVGGSMNASQFGIGGGWWGLRAKPQLVTKFPGGADSPDERALFHTDGQSLEINDPVSFNSGFAVTKYRNVTSSGAPGSNSTHPDTDFPLFRLGDAYLMYAEAVLRGGGGTREQALAYVNALRERAYGDESGNVTDAQLTLDFILAERARELYWEAHRRTDLVRFDQFSDHGVWSWKGGTQAGSVTDAKFDLYPLPSNELLTNPNLAQNPGYGS